jgi:hypothetical protein
MAGKYHRTYLKEDLQVAFEEMQEDTGVASNAYIAAAVRVALERDGYLEKLEPRRRRKLGQ